MTSQAQPLHEAPAGAAAPLAWLLAGLDGLATGLALFDALGQRLYANQAGREHLQAQGGELTPAHWPSEQRGAGPRSWTEVLARVCGQGHRLMYELEGNGQRLFVALTPVAAGEQRCAMVVFGRRELTGSVELQMFASSCGLTGTEHRVLDLLTQGLSTVDIAREHGVAQSTVLTHVAAIRSKTSSHSVRQLINTLARIPPLAPRALMQ